MNLPNFKYHPDPLATGMVIPSNTRCVCCGQVQGFIYIGPVYAEESYEECICPWCIADGSAHEKLDASFTDEAGISSGDATLLPQAVIDEVAFRTPGYHGWQQEQWWGHCGDAAQFLGAVGRRELSALGPQAIAAIREATSLEEGPKWEQFFAALDKEGSPRAYLFRCTKCGAYGGFQDCD